MTKPDTVEIYYLIGYTENGKHYYYMEREYNTLNHILTISHKVQRFSDKEEAIRYCKDLNESKSEEDRYLYVYERRAEYYDRRILEDEETE